MTYRVRISCILIAIILSFSACNQVENGLNPSSDSPPSEPSLSQAPRSEIYYNHWGGLYGIHGYDADHITYYPSTRPGHRRLDFVNPRFLGYFFDDTDAEVSLDWDYENGILSVRVVLRGEFSVYVDFGVRIEDSVLLSKEFGPIENDKLMNLSDEAIIEITYKLFDIMQAAEEYRRITDPHWNEQSIPAESETEISYEDQGSMYIIHGYDASHISYFPEYGQLYCANPRFLGYFFADSVTEGGANWNKEDGILGIGFTRQGRYISGTINGPNVGFSVKIEDGTLLSKEFTPFEDDEPIELSDEAMIEIAYKLFDIVKGVQEYIEQ